MIKNLIVVQFLILTVGFSGSLQSKAQPGPEPAPEGLKLQVIDPSIDPVDMAHNVLHLRLLNETDERFRLPGLNVIIGFSTETGGFIGYCQLPEGSLGAQAAGPLLPGKAIDLRLDFATSVCTKFDYNDHRAFPDARTFFVTVTWNFDPHSTVVHSGRSIEVHSDHLPVRGMNSSQLSDAGDLIHVFATSHDASDLDKAFTAVKLASNENSAYPPPAQTSTQIAPAKKPIDPQLVTIWLELYSSLDATEGMLLKDQKLPVTRVLPPGENGGPAAYPAPIPPSEIRDPIARKQYEDAIDENERRRKASINLSQIQRIRMDVSSFFWLWASGLYKDDPKAVASVVKEATTLGCSDSRAEWIGAVMGGARGSFPPAEPQFSTANSPSSMR